jgi:transposase
VGRAPVLRRRTKRREVSSIVALTAPLDGHTPRLYARHVLGASHGEDVIPALRYFRARIGCRLLIVWDHLTAHRTRCVRACLARHPDDVAVAWLPGYAPELNPDEQCNNCVKLGMLNATPESDDELRSLARRHFERLARKPHLLYHCFAHAGLSVAQHI